MITTAQLAHGDMKDSTVKGTNSHEMGRAMIHRDHITKDHSRKVFLIFTRSFSCSLIVYKLSEVFLCL